MNAAYALVMTVLLVFVPLLCWLAMHWKPRRTLPRETFEEFSEREEKIQMSREHLEYLFTSSQPDALELGDGGRRFAVIPAGTIPAHLFECDCGRQHPVGWICASAHRDQL